MITKILKLIVGYRTVLIWLVLLLLFGSTLLQFRAISDPKPEPAYVNSKSQALGTNQIEIKDSLRSQINKLHPTSVHVTPAQVGKPNPFSP